jgi:hypothetical protein
MTKPTGVGKGGRREGAGRPKGSKTKVYRPHVELVLASEGIMPKQVLLAVMRRHYHADRFDEAARVAAMVAPYIHPRLSSADVTVKPSIARMVFEMSDDELAEHVNELKALVGLSDEERALVRAKPKGSA